MPLSAAAYPSRNGEREDVKREQRGRYTAGQSSASLRRLVWNIAPKCYEPTATRRGFSRPILRRRRRRRRLVPRRTTAFPSFPLPLPAGGIASVFLAGRCEFGIGESIDGENNPDFHPPLPRRESLPGKRTASHVLFIFLRTNSLYCCSIESRNLDWISNLRLYRKGRKDRKLQVTWLENAEGCNRRAHRERRVLQRVPRATSAIGSAKGSRIEIASESVAQGRIGRVLWTIERIAKSGVRSRGRVSGLLPRSRGVKDCRCLCRWKTGSSGPDSSASRTRWSSRKTEGTIHACELAED